MEWVPIQTKPFKRYHVGEHFHEMKQPSEQRVGSLNPA